MGYWGFLIAAKSDDDLGRLAEQEPFGGDYLKVEPLGGGWQHAWVAGAEEDPDMHAGISAIANATGAPAIIAYILDSDCGPVVATTPAGDTWTGTLAKSTAMSNYQMPDDGISPDTATDTLIRWGEVAGLTPHRATLLEALAPDAIGPEHLFTLLLEGLGITPAKPDVRLAQ